jgi:hypothetical protein
MHCGLQVMHTTEQMRVKCFLSIRSIAKKTQVELNPDYAVHQNDWLSTRLTSGNIRSNLLSLLSAYFCSAIELKL